MMPGCLIRCLPGKVSVFIYPAKANRLRHRRLSLLSRLRYAAVCRMLRPPPESQISRSHNVHAVQQTLNNGGSARIGNATSIANPVTDNRRGDRLDIFGNQVLAPINESPGFGTAQQRQRTAGRQSVAEFLRVSRITDQTLQVIQDAVAGLDLISRSLE